MKRLLNWQTILLVIALVSATKAYPDIVQELAAQGFTKITYAGTERLYSDEWLYEVEFSNANNVKRTIRCTVHSNQNRVHCTMLGNNSEVLSQGLDWFPAINAIIKNGK